MKKCCFILLILSIIMVNCTNQSEKLIYPASKKVDTTDVYFGKEIPDPYRWLEDDNSEETAEWVKEQNAVTFGYLEKISFRDKLKERLTHIWNYPKFGIPFKEGDKYFFFKNDGIQNQSVLYFQTSLDAEPEMLLDPNTFSEDGTVALSSYSVSKDGKYLAYSVARSGSDWNEIFVLEIETKELLEDHIEWVKFSGISWKGNGFYYSRYDAPAEGEELSGKNEFHKVYFHNLNTKQDEDQLVYENPEFPQRNYYAQTTEDERFLIIYESETTSGNSIYCKDLEGKESGFLKLTDGFDYEYQVVDNLNSNLLIKTNYEAPKSTLVVMDPLKPEPENWKVVLPEMDEVLENVVLCGDKIMAAYMKDAYSRAYIYDYEGNQISEMQLPGIGSLAGFSGKKGDNLAFYGYTSFTSPSETYSYNIESGTSEIYRKSAMDFDSDQYETSQVFVESKDGTKVPIFIVHKKGLVKDGQNPTMLYGYGGFNISLTPSFSISRTIFLENGGIYVLANIRGGGEYGEEWHKAGIKTSKQNVFDDFIAAAEYLIANKYTSPEKLAIIGGSNGGLLVGACMTQRPDLFKVAIPQVGVLDMLRYHKFTIGWAWAGDYGTSEESEEMFNYLLGYSPIHNLEKGVCYPATMIMTADHDDRVVPAHSFKFAATIQEMQGCNNPVLIRIETKAGHGGGKPTSKIIEEYADIYAFIMYNLGMNPTY